MPLPPSLLKEVIERLPQDWKMKKSAIPGYLAKRGVKPEELEYSGITQGVTGFQGDKLTKQDLVGLEGTRKDIQDMAQPSEAFQDTTLPGTEGLTYKERVRTYKTKGEQPRKVQSHFPQSDYLWHTRTSEDVIDGKNTRVVQEIQSDLHQQGRTKGYNTPEKTVEFNKLKDELLEAQKLVFEAEELNMPSLTQKRKAARNDLALQVRALEASKIVPDAPYKTTWSRKAIEQEILDAHATGKDAIAIPLQGSGVEALNRSLGVQKWYETQVRGTMKKIAKAMGGEYKEANISGVLAKPTDFDKVNAFFEANPKAYTFVKQADEKFTNWPEQFRDLSYDDGAELDTYVHFNWDKIRAHLGSTVDTQYGQIVLPKDKTKLSSLKLYAAGGAEALLISQSLSDGAPPNELKEFLVQEQNMSEEDASASVDRAVRLMMDSAKARGANDEELNEFLTTERGYAAEYIASLGEQKATEEAPVEEQEELGFFEQLKQELEPAYQALIDTRKQEFPEEFTAPALAAKVSNIHAKYATMPRAIKVGLGFGTQEDRANALADTTELSNLIVNNLSAEGINAQVDPRTGDIVVQDEQGTWDVLDVGIWDSIVATKGEIFGGIAGSTAATFAAKGLEVPGPAIVKAGVVAIAAIAGGAIGATFGRATDITRNALETKEKIDSQLMWDQLKDAGAADVVFSVAGNAIFKLGIAGAKGVFKAYDMVLRGNQEGAYSALKEFMHLDDAQIDEIIVGWEQATGNKAPGLLRSTKALSIVPRVQPGGEAIVGPATTLDPIASSTISKEIANRADDLIKTAETASSDSISTILRDELVQYKNIVKQRYGGLKEFAIQDMADSGYTFDYSKLAIDPILERTVNELTNPAMREQALNFMQRIRALGGQTIEEITPATKEVTEARVFRRGGPTEVTKQVPTTVTREVTQPTLRSFEDLLELRRVVNEFGGKRFIRNAKDIQLIKDIRGKIDGEIAKASHKHMDQPETWLKAWKEANTEYGKMFDMEANVLYRNIIRKGTTDKAVAKQLMNRAMSTDNTFREVVEKLPPKMRALTENAVMQQFVEKFAIGEEGGMRAVQFPLLAKELSQIGFTTPKAQDLKRTITAMSEVFKNDVNLARVVGNMTVPKFQSYLTTDPVVRAKYEIASSVFNYIRRLTPTKRGDSVALIMKMGKVLEKPRNAKSFNELIKALPDDPELKNKLKAAQLEVAGYGQKSEFPQVTIHRSAAPGKSLATSKGELGEGVYYTVGKEPKKGMKQSTKQVLPSRIANEDNIKEALGIDQLTTKILRENPQVQEILTDKGYQGLSIGNKVLIFK